MNEQAQAQFGLSFSDTKGGCHPHPLLGYDSLLNQKLHLYVAEPTCGPSVLSCACLQANFWTVNAQKASIPLSKHWWIFSWRFKGKTKPGWPLILVLALKVPGTSPVLGKSGGCSHEIKKVKTPFRLSPCPELLSIGRWPSHGPTPNSSLWSFEQALSPLTFLSKIHKLA